MTTVDSIDHFIRLYDFENGVFKDVINVIKDRAKKVEYVWFNDILEMDNEHTRLMRNTLNELIRFIRDRQVPQKI